MPPSTGHNSSLSGLMNMKIMSNRCYDFLGLTFKNSSLHHLKTQTESISFGRMESIPLVQFQRLKNRCFGGLWWPAAY